MASDQAQYPHASIPGYRRQNDQSVNRPSSLGGAARPRPLGGQRSAVRLDAVGPPSKHFPRSTRSARLRRSSVHRKMADRLGVVQIVPQFPAAKSPRQMGIARCETERGVKPAQMLLFQEPSSPFGGSGPGNDAFIARPRIALTYSLAHCWSSADGRSATRSSCLRRYGFRPKAPRQLR